MFSTRSGLTVVTAMALALFLADGVADAGTVKVYLQAGQSNGDGRANPVDLPTTPVDLQQPQSDVVFFFHTQYSAHALDSTLTTLRPGTSETGQFGPEITFGRDMADFWSATPDTSVALVKYANGGTNLYSQWQPGGDATTSGDGSEYVVFQQTVAAGLAALQAAHPGDVIDVAGLIWMQGESDAASGQGAAYEANLTAFIGDVRATYGQQLPFIIGRLSAGQTYLPAAALQTVRDAQTNVAQNDPWAGLVDTDAFSLKADNLHFDATGQMQLGSGFAASMQTVPEPATCVLLAAGLTGMVMRRRGSSRHAK